MVSQVSGFLVQKCGMFGWWGNSAITCENIVYISMQSNGFFFSITCFQWAADQVVAPTIPAAIGASEDWGTSAANWGAETTTTISKDWGDIPSDPAQKEWGAEPASGDWGTSITMQDSNTGGAEWA